VIKSGSVLVINCGSSSIKFSVIDHETSQLLVQVSLLRIVVMGGATARIGGWPTWIPLEHPTPPFLYPWAETMATLAALKENAGDPYDGILLKYTHPVHRGPTLPTFSCGVQLLRPGEKTQTHRHNSTTIYQVFRGAGATPVEKEILEWNHGDIFVVPAWHWHSHQNRSDGDSILFSMTDAPTFSALGLYREESAAEQATEKDSYADCPEHCRRVHSTDFASTYKNSTPPLINLRAFCL
jgi:mannose-6-phosphate isomerase-like protein (cupin superfamily)